MRGILLEENGTKYALVQTPCERKRPIANEVWVGLLPISGDFHVEYLPFDSLVRISVMAKDISGNTMKQAEEFGFQG